MDWGSEEFWSRVTREAILALAVYTIGHATSWISLDLTNFVGSAVRRAAIGFGVFVIGFVITYVVYMSFGYLLFESNSRTD